MSHIELTPKVFHRYPEVEVGLDGVETAGEKIEEWLSFDSSKKISLSITGGGSWNSTWLKELKLETINKTSVFDMMKVQFTKNTDLDSECTTISIDAIKRNGEGWVLETYTYSTDLEGIKEDIGFRCEIEILDAIQGLADGVLRNSDDLPERIDVEETARIFVEQLQERNFNLPELIGII